MEQRHSISQQKSKLLNEYLKLENQEKELIKELN